MYRSHVRASFRHFAMKSAGRTGRGGEFLASVTSDGAAVHRLQVETASSRATRGSAVPRHAGVTAKAIKVLCVVPYGRHGRGGIDRLYDHLQRFHEAEGSQGIEISYFSARGSAPGNLWLLAFPWRAVLFATRLLHQRPDIVHLNFSVRGSTYRKYALLLIAKAFAIPTVVHFHGNFASGGVGSRVLITRCFRSMTRLATRTVVLGEYYRAAFIDVLGVPAAKLEVLANSVPDFFGDRTLPKPRHPTVNLLFIGALGRHKGIDVLVDALTQLALRTREWSCIIAGHGDARPYAARIAAAGCGDLVRFTGWQEPGQVERLLVDCDVVILPSRGENMPLALIEGACAGAALVATNVGEVPELLQQERNGLLVELTATSLAQALERLIVDRAELAKMQSQSRAIYREKFDINAFVAGLTGIYRRAMTVRS
jgi:glycosyltransferase involved in cell wall biosynthesis